MKTAPESMLHKPPPPLHPHEKQLNLQAYDSPDRSVWSCRECRTVLICLSLEVLLLEG